MRIFHTLPIWNAQNVEKLDFLTIIGGPKHEKPKLVGWCDTNIGKMGVFECTCGQKYRFHCTVGTWIADDDEFDHYLYYKAKKCTNWEEIKEKLANKDV